MKIETIIDAVKKSKSRSAWGKGVKQYAVELLYRLECDIIDGYITTEDICNPALLEKALLNGARSWRQYSEGGCALVYDQDIALRLCTLSELKRTDNGRKEPNKRETWIDVQSRALFQAWLLIKSLVF